MATMKAYTLVGHGGPEMLVYRTDFPKPVAGPGEVVIRVGACGCNNTDINTRVGWYSKAVTSETSQVTTSVETDSLKDDGTWGGYTLRFPRVQGADVCGVVVEVGPEVNSGLVGKRVLIDTWVRAPDAPDDLRRTKYFGSELDGGFAQFTKCPASQVHPIESTLSDAELATFATSYVTAENMLNRAAVKTGDVVLIPGASGGVGSALVQLAKRRGAVTVAMCSEAKRRMVIDAVSPDAVLSREPENLPEALRKAIGRDTVDVLADVVGGPYWPKLLEVIERGGRLTCAGAIAGPVVPFDLRTFYLNDLTFVGATVVPEGVFEDLVSYVEKNEIKPLLAATYPLTDLPKAQDAFLSKKFVGNIVILVNNKDDDCLSL